MMMQAVTKLGTRGYAAPEVFTASQYDEKCDVWSLGVIVYIMLSGLPPFVEYDENSANTPFCIYVNQMTESPDKKLEFPREFWKDISDQAKHFCTCCLQIDPKRRARSTDLVGHPWFKTQVAKQNLQTQQFRRKVMSVSVNQFDFSKALEFHAQGNDEAFLRLLNNYTKPGTLGGVRPTVSLNQNQKRII